MKRIFYSVIVLFATFFSPALYAQNADELETMVMTDANRSSVMLDSIVNSTLELMKRFNDTLLPKRELLWKQSKISDSELRKAYSESVTIMHNASNVIGEIEAIVENTLVSITAFELEPTANAAVRKKYTPKIPLSDLKISLNTSILKYKTRMAELE